MIRSYVTNLLKGRIENPGYEKLRAIAEAMGFPLALWFVDDLAGGADAGADGDLVVALRDDLLRAIIRESSCLSGRDKEMILGIVRQFRSVADAFDNQDHMGAKSKEDEGLATHEP